MSIEGWLVFLVVGEIAGWMTGVIMRGGNNLIGDMIIGTLGALTGAFIFSFFNAGALNLIGSLVIAFIGGVGFVFLLRKISQVTT